MWIPLKLFVGHCMKRQSEFDAYESERRCLFLLLDTWHCYWCMSTEKPTEKTGAGDS